MQIDIDTESRMILRKVFNSVFLISDSAEQFIICMRDSGFEFYYGGQWYEAKEGKMSPLSAKNTEQLLQPDSGE